MHDKIINVFIRSFNKKKTYFRVISLYLERPLLISMKGEVKISTPNCILLFKKVQMFNKKKIKKVTENLWVDCG